MHFFFQICILSNMFRQYVAEIPIFFSYLYSKVLDWRFFSLIYSKLKSCNFACQIAVQEDIWRAEIAM